MSDYLDEITLIDQSDLSLRNKYIRLKRILDRSCKDFTAGESLQFPSLFSRLVFIAQRYNFPKLLEWQLQNIRVKSTFLLRNEQNLISASQYGQAVHAIRCFLSILDGQEYDASILKYEPENTPPKIDCLRVQVLEIDSANCILHCQPDSLIDEVLQVRYNVPKINDAFTASIHRLWIGAQLNLIESKIDDDGMYIPKTFVLEPDYLIDASAIAECFQNYSTSHLHYFRRKLEPPVNTHYILLGNLANYFLDELIYADDVDALSFDEVFMRSFRTMPFEYASCQDIKANSDFKEFMVKAKTQFDNIKRVVKHDLPTNGFDRHRCVLEPSFFSEKYGFQGRLDLLQPTTESDGLYRIVELKSGKPPYPRDDATKVATNHETQTVVYRLMIQSAFGKEARDIYPTILYSSVENEGENLRLAAPYQQLEKEIIDVRNQIVATEHDLYTGNSETVELFLSQLFDIESYERVPPFFVDKLRDTASVISKASAVDKAYFHRYITFLARELYLQKMGDESHHSTMSTSALWNSTYAERKDALELIGNLEIEEINGMNEMDNSGRGMTIRFSRDESTNFVNFREGEICVLYPRQNEGDTILSNQILKGTVVEISSAHVLLRFRYKQRNRAFFDQYRYWTVEHDKLDHSYNAMFKSLFAFVAAPCDKRNLLLGLRPPRSPFRDLSPMGDLTKNDKERSVIDRALAADDYFLIVGPPGTGKTSIFARQLISRFYADADTNILVMAYTNRAVDELCSAICEALGQSGQSGQAADNCDGYIRIGSELSCSEASRPRLLQNIAGEAQSRRDLNRVLQSTRIFVGTLASIVGKPELFGLKKFDVAIIDEASQILEPQIVGLLPLFDKFVMIGDHKQLSTITLQDKSKSQVDEPCLNNVGLYDCSESLFERLFRLCQSHNWHWAYDTLNYHGRMHADIAALVNVPFYDGVLHVATNRQLEPLRYVLPGNDARQSLVARLRVAFVPVHCVGSGSLSDNLSDKTNESEADEVVALCKAFHELYMDNGLVFDASRTLGVIAPYRNQIALIKHKLQLSGIAELGQIMVDTVERYQGSQRDVIVVSFCFNRVYQMRSFANMNREGRVDRKLNVALTRAREQLFLVGNEGVMRQNVIYGQLLDRIEKVSR